MQATNVAWSKEYNTIGCVTGVNNYYYGPNEKVLFDDLKLIHWHGLSMSHMFQKKQLALEPGGGKVSAGSLEIIHKQDKPLIQNWDYLEPITDFVLIDKPRFLQRIILAQEQSLEKLKQENQQLQKELKSIQQV